VARTAAFVGAGLVWATLAGSLGCSARVETPPPNFVVIIADDHGYPDFGFMGSQIVRTPHLDELAASGTVFVNGYSTASVCAPALRSLLTGLHPIEFNAVVRSARPANDRAGATEWLDPTPHLAAMQTLPRRLAEQGYASFQSGKYWDTHFARSGFSHGMTSGPDGMLDGIRIARETMQPVFDFVDEQRDGPFLLWFAPMLPHLPFDAAPEFEALYADSDVPEDARGYYANVTRFDASVGQLMGHLRSRQLLERTVVVFVSDNGWQAGAQPGASKGKNTPYELGFRTPIVLSGPGIPRGVQRGDLVTAADLLPTLLDYAGVDAASRPDARSLRSAIDSGEPVGREAILGAIEPLNPTHPGWIRTRPPPVTGYRRDARWHYIQHAGGRAELYDLANDPHELDDVSVAQPERVARFADGVDAWYRGALRYRSLRRTDQAP
jgi:uncharacterized sulfatase